MKGLLVDANLLCLLVVGLTDQAAIQRHKRLGAYSVEDFVTATEIVDCFGDLILCPQVVAETSNLLRHSAEGSGFSEILRRLVHQYEERSRASREAVESPSFMRLGVTDAVLILLAGEAAALFSADAKLCHAVEQAGHRAINYNYVRDGALTSSQIKTWAIA